MALAMVENDSTNRAVKMIQILAAMDFKEGWRMKYASNFKVERRDGSRWITRVL